MGKKGIPHRKFSKEEKLKYVRLHLDNYVALRRIERECGIRNTLVAEWIKRYLQDGEEALEPHNIPVGYSRTIWHINAARLPVFVQKQGNEDTNL